MKQYTDAYINEHISRVEKLIYYVPFLNRYHLPLQHLLSGNGTQFKREKLPLTLGENRVSSKLLMKKINDIHLCCPLPCALHWSESRDGGERN